MDKLIILIKDKGKMSTPTRTREVRHGGKNFIGHFPSIKMKKMIDFESLLERDLIYLLDYDANVMDFTEQPLTIPINISGRRQQYTPDFLVNIYAESTLLEVKPIRFVEEFENSIKCEFIKDYCKEHGWNYHIVTERDIRRRPLLENVKLLTQYARHPADPYIDAGIISGLFKQPAGMPLIDILKALNGSSRGEIFASVFRLAFHHEISLLLDASPINLDTTCAIGQPGTNLSTHCFLISILETQ